MKITNNFLDKNYEEKQKALNEFFLYNINLSTKDIVFNLIYGNNLLFIPNKYIEDSVNNEADKLIYKLFSPRNRDINGNEQNTDVKDYLQFLYYKNSLPLTINFTFDIIMVCIANKKLSYTKLSKHLKHEFIFWSRVECQS